MRPHLLCALLLLIFLVGCASTAPELPAYVWEETPASRETARRLGELMDVRWEKVTLAAALEELSAATGTDIRANWAALEPAMVGKAVPITMHLKQAPAHAVLRLVLDQCRAASLLPLDYGVGGDAVVYVSTTKDLTTLAKVNARVYDIRDLLIATPHQPLEGPVFDLNSALSCTSSGGGIRGSDSAAQAATTLFSADKPTVEDRLMELREERLEGLMTMIQDTIGVQSDWAVYGGDLSSIRELHGNLIVKTTPANHRDIERLLRRLRPADWKETKLRQGAEGKAIAPAGP